MKRYCLWTIVCGLVCIARLGAAAEANPPPRLTVDLRDGSKVRGTSMADKLVLHSALLGDVKLALADVRTMDFTATNLAKLTTVNGDVLTVDLPNVTFKLRTSFGQVELGSDSIRKLIVATGRKSIPQHDGLVAFWGGDGNARDSVGGHDGELVGDCGFGPGSLGQAFQFNTSTAAVKIPASPALDVGSGNGFTLEAWINPSEISQGHPIFEWNNSTYWGVHFHIAPGQPFNTPTGPGELYANIPDRNGGWHQLSSPAGAVVENQFQLVTLTYEQSTGTAIIYCNGKVVAQQTFPPFTPQTRYDLYLGHRLAPAGEMCSFAGLIGNAAVYNRALTAAEIVEDYEAGNPE